MVRNWYLAGIFLASSFTSGIAHARPVTSWADLPDSPDVQQTSQTTQPTPTPATPPSSSSQPQSTATQSTKESSQDELQKDEHQRILGIMPTFNSTSNQNAPPLTAGQKFQLFFKNTTDPWNFGLAAFEAGIGQAENSPEEYGQGFEGYAKRYGANYTDTFDGNLWGNAILTSWWHEDPRFFRKGSGSFMGRAGWAAASTVWCKRDNGTWGLNYANVIGNWIGAAIGNVYYPASERTVGQTFKRGTETTAYGIIGAEVIEFWPDIANHYIQKRRAKKAREAAQQDASQAAASAH